MFFSVQILLTLFSLRPVQLQDINIDGLTGATLSRPNVLLNDVLQARPIEKCCQRLVRYKHISRVVVQNNIEYECRGYIRQGYCAGECESESEFVPAVYSITTDSTGNRITVVHEREKFATKDVFNCLPTDRIERSVSLTCRARRECCETVDQQEIKIKVTYQEPSECRCQEVKVASLRLPCSRRMDERFHYFSIAPLILCRTTDPENLPYCRGFCRSFEWSYDTGFTNRFEYKYCTCCEATRNAKKRVRITCRYVSSDLVDSIRPSLLDPDSASDELKRIFELDAANFGWSTYAILVYPSACGCQRCEN